MQLPLFFLCGHAVFILSKDDNDLERPTIYGKHHPMRFDRPGHAARYGAKQ